jgi:hypothetical protein
MLEKFKMVNFIINYHGSKKKFTKLPNPTTHLTISSLKKLDL